MKTWNTKTVLVTGLVIGFGACYLIYPKINPGNSNISFENSRSCQEAAMALHKQDGKDLEATGQSQMEPVYKYIEKENICLYKGGFITNETTHRYIKNVLTNETLAEYIINLKGVEILGSKSDFDRVESKYFTN